MLTARPGARGAGGRRRRLGVAATAAFLLLGGTATVLVALDISFAVASAAIGLLTMAATVVGPALHRPRPALMWRLATLAVLFFIASPLLRPWAFSHTDWRLLTADAFSITGYLLTAAVLACMLRNRRNVDRHAVLDGVTICIGAVLVAVAVVTMPASAAGDRPLALTVVSAVYPVIDVVLLLLTLNLAFTTAVRNVSFVLCATGMVSLFVADSGYLVMGVQGWVTTATWMHVPYDVALLCLGAAALHPSMRALTAVQPRAVQSWSTPRLVLLLASLTIPSLLPLVHPAPNTAVKAAYAFGGLAMVGTLLLRAVSAVGVFARAQGELRQQATHDALTGLANRVLLLERIESLLRDSPDRVQVLFMDLDGFKLVNDSYGHGLGDELLVEVAERLRSALRDADVVARVGGDEFVIAASVPDDVDPRSLAERAMRAFDEPFRLSAAEVVVTPSIGLAAARLGETDVEGLLRDADTALYRAKGNGRNGWAVFDDSMHQEVRDRVETELELRRALPHGELSLEFQPVVQLSTSVPLGVEALLRWDSPALGRVSPVDFIPIAEDSGLIVEIGAWVVTAALEQLADWRDRGVVHEEYGVSVNVSTKQLHDPTLLRTVLHELDRHSIPPRCLTLEVTESAMLQHGGVSAETLQRLHAEGVRIAIDDFGTGYSSLSYLRRFDVDVVKVDRSFVSGLGRPEADPRDEELVRAIVGMARALRLTVVAEGIETAEQRAALLGLDADHGQGWLFGRPVPAARLFAPGPTPAGGEQAGQGGQPVLAHSA